MRCAPAPFIAPSGLYLAKDEHHGVYTPEPALFCGYEAWPHACDRPAGRSWLLTFVVAVAYAVFAR